MFARSINISCFFECLCGLNLAAVPSRLFLGLGTRKSARFLSSPPPESLTLNKEEKHNPELLYQSQLKKGASLSSPVVERVGQHCSYIAALSIFSSNAKALRFSTKMRMQLICELYMASLKKWLLQLITRSTSVIAVFGTLLCTGPSNVRNQ